MEGQMPNLLITFLTTILAAFLGVFLALWKSKKENIWLLKQEAYINIIEALHNIVLWADQEYVENFPYPVPSINISKEKLAKLKVDQHASLEALKRYVHVGELLLSENATNQLNTLLSEYGDEELRHWNDPRPDEAYEYGMHEKSKELISEHFIKLRKIAEKHIDKVRVLAKKDLGLPQN